MNEGENELQKKVQSKEIFLAEHSNQEISNKNILLIEDIITTGNTIKLCADKLFEAGARDVFALAWGKTKRLN